MDPGSKRWLLTDAVLVFGAYHIKMTTRDTSCHLAEVHDPAPPVKAKSFAQCYQQQGIKVLASQMAHSTFVVLRKCRTRVLRSSKGYFNIPEE